MKADFPESNQNGHEKKGKPSSTSAGAATMASQVSDYVSFLWKEVQVRTGHDHADCVIYGSACMLFFVWLMISLTTSYYGPGVSYALLGATFSIWNTIITLCCYYKIKKDTKDVSKTQ